jgi:Vacuolar sorting protein 9 (VPS9) domain
MMNSEMRSAVIKHHHAKTEIEGMDHELPVTIFIVSRAKCRKLASNLQYILSFLKTKEESDHQERILNTVIVALDYICSDWKIEDIKKLSAPEEQPPTTSI